MFTFFHGWRRKAGCVTLVMALAAMILWIRSRHMDDAVRFNLLGRTYVLATNADEITWWTWDEEKTKDITLSIFWDDMPDPADVFAGNSRIANLEVKQALYVEIGSPEQVYRKDIRHWALVWPLTLLSAYLILWKPQKRTAKAVESLS